ncbi:uncharacterized protein LOC111265065 [Varroa jacobsoni]|uniref:Uncharacterized protein n=1 Tax=Varroa destructor TaxID=109461 RepID=A0A7M7KA38_VARDE|nr:uncharacterized protein LOC111250950 [Varroa destructor]XP_022697144.1 uncharacterized protein LOC111265065 [Varroa jacobsoni]XP_022697145.1 uncharacterized protein LOC111265065 [Varroa jacobsoni]XP_022697146.1 uncharacterized protein LOC111265065 [Varroa jacobsoni]XP_022697147.1 uncharacterized protein LOC111265065 [Varroa jacobsoni]XP_022697148.1 uncharacterized protein LOC111265065 [Varroa jacobsoni]XP_022697149.1 uncharacterized protein LOC111265065 [Varroa jacobsoni]XP_022697150.1 un
MESLKKFFAKLRNTLPSKKSVVVKEPKRNKLTTTKSHCRRRAALAIKRQTITALVIPSIMIITVGGLVIPLHFLFGLAVFCFGLILLLPLPLVIWKMKTFLVEEDCMCCCCCSAVASVSSTIDRKIMMGSMSCINGMVDVGPSYVNYAYDAHLDFPSSRPMTPASSSFYTINSSLSGSLPVLNSGIIRESSLI